MLFGFFTEWSKNVNMNFYVPVQIITGKGCVAANSDIFKSAGKRCLIVTGKSAAKKSGALDDLIAVLTEADIGHAVFDGIEQNPSYASCLTAATVAKDMDADFVVGIGGGSPLDAAKAIAVLSACKDTSAEALFSMKWDATPLPVIAIGTTAGTGSEVTPVAVITNPEGRKLSIRAASIYPIAALGDASYTTSLSTAFTRSTALDALAHCLESYFNRTANDISKLFAQRGIAILVKMLEKTGNSDADALSFDDREALYIASLYGGLAISVTGTAFPHALGYFLSEQYGIPHGNACAVYLEDFIAYNVATAPEEAKTLLAPLGISADDLIALVRKNLPAISITLSRDEIAVLAPRYENNKSLNKCLGNVGRAFAVSLLEKLFSN